MLRLGNRTQSRPTDCDVQGRKTLVFHRVSRPERPSCQLGKLAATSNISRLGSPGDAVLGTAY